MNCKHCNKEYFEIYGKAGYCSKTCSKIGSRELLKNRVILFCQECKKKFEVVNWQKNKKFCNVLCSNKQPRVVLFNKTRKGKNYSEIYREVKKDEIIKKKKEKLLHTIKNYSIKRKKEISSIRSIAGKKAGNGGYRVGSGRGKGTWYESYIAGKVYCDSSYELAYAKWLDENVIKWQRNNKKFPYIFEGKKLNYMPDFYLIDEDCYIEIKGFKTLKDKAKWEYFPLTLKVLFKQDLNNLKIVV